MNTPEVDDFDPALPARGIRTQLILSDPGRSALEKYRQLVIGSQGNLFLIRYELITGLLGGIPGLLGLGLRRVFYPSLLKEMGRNVAIGRNVVLRNPRRISLGQGVVIDDNVVLDAKGNDGEGINIKDKVYIGRGTILSARSGTIEVGEGSSISSYCRIGPSRIGRKVLIAAYVYLIGGGHQSDRVDIPVIEQPLLYKGGLEVGDGCWIGAFTAVMDGVKLGNDTIIGAHSLVTKDIPALSVAFGVPAQVTRQRSKSGENLTKMM